jgi:hypothetical protein
MGRGEGIIVEPEPNLARWYRRRRHIRAWGVRHYRRNPPESHADIPARVGVRDNYGRRPTEIPRGVPACVGVRKVGWTIRTGS